MSILAAYEQAIKNKDISDDFGQRKVVGKLQRLQQELVKPKRVLFRRQRPQGIYLYGPVGVGKTYLVDLFYQSLDYRQKARFHFHHFMQQVDQQLRRLQGVKDPLKKIAANFASTTKLLCFDEFLVHDVAYAMILSDLLQALLQRGVVLVMTSNTRPEDLYLNGVQRARFLPAIDLIKQHCDIVTLGEHKDYRLGRDIAIESWLYPLDSKTEAIFQQQFQLFALNAQEQGVLLVQNREIPYIKCKDKTVWFDFQVICNVPRSQLDYLEIAQRFDTIFISNIPKLGEKDTLKTILLIHFIDVLYDRGIRLMVSAAAPPEELYLKGEMRKEFQRTLSRLQEMRSVDYVKRHKGRALQHL